MPWYWEGFAFNDDFDQLTMTLSCELGRWNVGVSVVRNDPFEVWSWTDPLAALACTLDGWTGEGTATAVAGNPAPGDIDWRIIPIA